MLRKGLGSKVMPDFSFARTSSLYLEESVVVKSCRALCPGDLNLTSMLTATRHHDFLDSAFLPRLCCSCYRPIKAGRADSEASRKLSVPCPRTAITVTRTTTVTGDPGIQHIPY